MHQYVLGGGFGGKQDYDDILAAAYCAKEVGRPVKLIQTRETQFATSFPRTPTYHKLKAGLKNGELVAMNHDIVLRLDGPALLRRQEVRHRLAAARFLGREEAGHRSVVDRRQRSLVLREEPSRPRLGQRPHHLGGAGQRAAHRVQLATTCSWSSRSWTRWRTRWAAIRSSSACRCSTARAATAAFPTPAIRPGTPSDYYMDRLWISLPWPNEGTWTPYESAHGRWRAASRQLPAGSGRQSRLGLEEAAAEHRDGHGRLLRGGTAESDLGGGHRGGHGRSEDRQVQDQQDHDRDGHGHVHQPA